jgi:predicted MPP superfamily phosphohydrolase
VTHRGKKWLTRALARPPYHDAHGRKGWLTPFSRAQPHRVRRVALTIPGWPKLRVAFLSDFHAGSHADDLTRLRAIVAEAAALRPDLALHGGDFVNMQLFGGGRLAPRVIAKVLAGLDAPLGRFAVLGNHDYTYGADGVAAALREHGITVLDDERRTLDVAGTSVDLIGLPDARVVRPRGRTLLAALDKPTLVLAHDPAWFADLAPGPHLMLAGHTHGGQFRFPLIGPLVNMSRAPLRWSHGLIEEGGRRLYVTSGLGTSGVPLRIGVPPEFVIIDVNG